MYQSMQSGVGKLSCNKTALKRCTSTETLCNRKAPSLSSPEDEEIFLPKLPKSWHLMHRVSVIRMMNHRRIGSVGL